MGFLEALGQYPFLQYALAGGLLASLGCGLIGPFVVVRRLGYMAGGIAHSVLGGMGAALLLGAGPFTGALVAAIAAALAIGLVKLHLRHDEDTVIGAVWAVGMAAGILFISRLPGYNIDLIAYLFGNVLMVSPADLVRMASLDGVILLVLVLSFDRLVAVAFDPEFARLRGVPVDAYYLLTLCLVALSVVLLVRVVGLILVIALLTLPAAIARQIHVSLRAMMATSCLLGALFTTTGLALAYHRDWPAGATIILLAGLAYLLVVAAGALRRRPAR
ncbi:MAG: metal ABC transporter permease [Gammaproteobacteria bacterium]|nr:MAG: metal ABC transporter permease [Gammaproteobacteria bacterium]